MSVSKLEAYYRSVSEANELKKKYDKSNSDGVLNKEELVREKMKEIFRHHDKDKDGFLNLKELTKAFGFLGSIIPFQKALYALAYADADKDGLISEAEFDKLVDYATKFIKKKKLRAC